MKKFLIRHTAYNIRHTVYGIRHTTYGIRHTERGVSLLEAVVYIAILAMFFIIVVHATLLASEAFGKSRVKRALASEGQTAMARILREARFADRADEAASIFGAHPGRLALETRISPSDPTPITRVFSLQDEALFLTEGAGEPQALSRGIQITNLIFYLSPAPPALAAVRVEMTAESSYKSLSDTRKFYGTAVLRGSN